MANNNGDLPCVYNTLERRKHICFVTTYFTEKCS